MTTPANSNIVTDFCARYRVSSGKEADIRDGFDLSKPLYVHTLYPPTRLFQFIRLPSATNISPRLGNWFALRGATMAGLAIFGGLAGRRQAEFDILRPIEVLEGTAAPQARGPKHWDYAVAGPGGSTQIFVPDSALLALRGLGNV